jgi:hypothetical protein
MFMIRYHLHEAAINDKLDAFNSYACLVRWKDQDWIVANGWGLTSAMLVATTTFLESEGEGSKTSICSAMVRPECRAIGLNCSLFSGILKRIHRVSFRRVCHKSMTPTKISHPPALPNTCLFLLDRSEKPRCPLCHAELR